MMRKLKSFLRSPMGTTFMFMLAVLFLMTGTIGGVRAAPQILNREFYYGGLELDEIGVTLVEGESNISWRDYDKTIEAFNASSNNPSSDPEEKKVGVLLTNLIPAGEKLKVGYKYDEVLKVKNSGKIPEFVRVSVYKYWTDEKGNRFDAYNDNGTDIINKLIVLNFLEENGWIIDKGDGASTKERTVLYYQNQLDAGMTTPAFTDTLMIDNSIIDYATITRTEGRNTVTWVADGLRFVIEVEVDAVQNHNSKAAVKSSWGLTDTDIARLGLKVQ